MISRLKENLVLTLVSLGAALRKQLWSTPTSVSQTVCVKGSSEVTQTVVLSSTELSTQALMLKERYGINQPMDDE